MMVTARDHQWINMPTLAPQVRAYCHKDVTGDCTDNKKDHGWSCNENALEVTRNAG